MTKAEAQEELDNRIAADQKRPTALVAKKSTPVDESVAWMFAKYRELKRRSWADASREIFEWVSDNVILPAIGERSLASIKRDDCQQLLNDLADAGRSSSLIAKVRVNLKAVFDEALELDLIPKNPARKLDIPRTLAEKCSRFQTPEECERILAAAPTERDRLIIRIALVCGLRPGELFGLRRNDIEPGRIRIDETVRNGEAKSETKTKGSKGSVSMPPSLEIEMRAYLRTIDPREDALLFADAHGGEMRQGNYLRRVLHPIGRAAGVEGLNFQSLRRTTATYAGKYGSIKDAQAMLRHSTPQMTVGVYMQEIPESVQQTARVLDGLFGGKDTIQ
jgi:integrase